MEDTCNENFNTLIKEIKHTHIHTLKRLSIFGLVPKALEDQMTGAAPEEDDSLGKKLKTVEKAESESPVAGMGALQQGVTVSES